MARLLSSWPIASALNNANGLDSRSTAQDLKRPPVESMAWTSSENCKVFMVNETCDVKGQHFEGIDCLLQCAGRTENAALGSYIAFWPVGGPLVSPQLR